MTAKLRARNAILAALTADAATMPLHWLYGMDKVADAVSKHPDADVAFFPTPSCPFYNSSTHPGHYAVNQPSPYGEEFLCLLEFMAQNGGDFPSGELFADHLDKWCSTTGGRLNHCSKQFVENRQQTKPPKYPPGAEKDAQMNSVIKAVIITARYAGHEQLLAKTEECIRVHQNDDVAVQCGLWAARELERAILGGKKEEATPSAEYAAKHALLGREDFLVQLAKDCNIDPPMYASSCGLPHAYTTCLYFLAQEQLKLSLADLVRENIRFGGDNCSRAMFIAAVRAAEGESSMPAEWIQRVHDIKEIERMVDVVVGK